MFLRAGLLLLLAAGCSFSALGQSGDKPGETLSPVPARETQGPRTDPALAALLDQVDRNRLSPEALLPKLQGREIEGLEVLRHRAEWRQPERHREKILQSLAARILAEGRPERVEKLIDLAASNNPLETWQRVALLDGFLTQQPRDPSATNSALAKPIALPGEPKGLLALAAGDQPPLRERAERILPLLTWPGKDQPKPEAGRLLTEAEQARFEMGKTLYVATCGACHQPHGNGQEGLAPPLAGSEWVLGSEPRLVRITLHGVRGPITVKGQTYQLDMPPLNVLDDEQIAALLTYIRREWGHTASPVEPTTVAKIRAETEQRDEAWTQEELLKIDK